MKNVNENSTFRSQCTTFYVVYDRVTIIKVLNSDYYVIAFKVQKSYSAVINCTIIVSYLGL